MLIKDVEIIFILAAVQKKPLKHEHKLNISTFNGVCGATLVVFRLVDWCY